MSSGGEGSQPVPAGEKKRSKVAKAHVQFGERLSMDMWLWRLESVVNCQLYTLKLCSGLENGVWPRGSVRSAKTCLF